VRRLASAPGKAILLGEYAVLEGAPAVVTAVDRRARAAVEPIPERQIHVVSAERPGSAAVIELDASGWYWRDAEDAERLRLVHEVLRAILPARPQRVVGFRIQLDTQAFFASNCGMRAKLGLGSSAALTVACAAAVASFVRAPAFDARSPDWQAEVHRIHRSFQNGQGSGADIAASLCGGSLIYTRDPSSAGPQPLRWPATLHARFVWSGRSASTPLMLARLASFKSLHRAAYQRCLSRLVHLAEEGASALAAAQVAAFIDVADRYAAALAALDEASGIGIVSDEHARLRQIGHASGVVYKSCGAGGGDLGVALSRDRERLVAFDTAIDRKSVV
jgi:phosphomevalonate kinase